MRFLLERTNGVDLAECGGAVGAQAPERDLGFVDREARCCAGVEAGCSADSAVDVVDSAALAADDVVVVVRDATLEARGVAGRFDAADELGVLERGEHVVDRLLRDGAEDTTHVCGDLVGRGVWNCVERAVDGDARCGDSESARPKHIGRRGRVVFRGGCHLPNQSHFLDSFKKASYPR